LVKIIMADREIQTAHVKVPNIDLEIAAYLAAPTGQGSYPGIVVLQEIFGVNAHIREVTELNCEGRLCSDRASSISTHCPRF